MKKIVKNVGLAFAGGLFFSFLFGCLPLPEREDMFYHVEYSVTGDVPLANLSYYDENQEKITLDSQELPWSFTVAVPKSLPGTAYLGVQADSDSVFRPVFTSISSGYEERKVICSGGFTGLVREGDLLFPSATPVPHETDYTEVLDVDSDTTLSLAADLVTAGGMAFSIYRVREITLTIKVDDVVLKEKTKGDPFNISFYTQEFIGKAADDEDDAEDEDSEDDDENDQD